MSKAKTQSRRGVLKAICMFGLASACGEAGEATAREVGDLRRGILLVGSRPIIEYRVVDGELHFEGDIALAPWQVAPLDSERDSIEEQDDLGVASSELLGAGWANPYWESGVVPYTISSALSSALRAKAEDAIRQWNTQTSIQFVPRSNERDYVTFRYSNTTYAYANIGRVGGQQFVNLVERNPAGVIVHEMGHALGFFHEHTRPDRDSYVIVHWGNIISGLAGNFSIYSSGNMIGEYDIDSIMHYPSYEFSWNGRPTITRRDGSIYPTNYTALSTGDIEAVSQLYGGAPPQIVVDSNNGRNNTSRG